MDKSMEAIIVGFSFFHSGFIGYIGIMVKNMEATI